MTFAAKYSIDAHFELYIAIKYVESSLAEYYAMLRAIFSQDFAELMQGQSFSAPLLVKSLVDVIELTNVDACVD